MSISSNMSNRSVTNTAQNPAQIFAALGDPTRLMLIEKLGNGREQSINSLASDFQLTRQAITKHLHVLEDVGIVKSNRTGRENRFRGSPIAIDTAREYLDQVSRQWDDALKRLKTHIEE